MLVRRKSLAENGDFYKPFLGVKREEFWMNRVIQKFKLKGDRLDCKRKNT